MLYGYFVKKSARQNFANVQHHKYDEVLKAVVPHVTHHFAGDHALGGTRHDAEALRQWFERLGRVLPTLQFEIKQIWVKGMPWNTTVIVQWVATTTLKNGDPYVNPGIHVIHLRWGKVYSLDVSEILKPWLKVLLNKPKPVLARLLRRRSKAKAVRSLSVKQLLAGFKDKQYSALTQPR